jgi:hypothetical protein
VWIEIPRADLQPGAASRELRIRKIALRGMELAIEADIRTGGDSTLILETPWRISNVDGGSAARLSPTRTEIHVAPAAALVGANRYVTTIMRIRFQQP